MSARVSSALPRSGGVQPPRLRERRRRSRRLLLAGALVLLFLLVAACVYALWQPSLRVSQVAVYGADASYSSYATAAMAGTYAHLIPRDSTFFIPEASIRTSIIAAHPEVAAVSFFSHGLTGLTINVSLRTPVGRWCGSTSSPQAASTPYPAPGAVEGCYLYDPSGYIYAPLPESSASSTSAAPDTRNSFALYAPLVGTTEEPVGATIAQAAQLPAAANLARQVASFGSPAIAVVVRNDECDIELASGTRITYLLGSESDAFAALSSAKANLNLADGSLDYVDLRFPGKVYLKKKGS